MSSVTHPAYAIKTINLNVTGGDCQLGSIGNWTAATNTCTLSKDITGEGIIIGDNNVILDGNGHTISGTSGNGVLVQIKQGVTIKNLKIQNFDTGINVDNSNGVTLSGNTITGSSTGISVSNSNTLTINGNSVSGIGGDGITFAASQSSINNNIISNNKGNGIYLQSSSTTVSSNTIQNNNLMGIYMVGAASNTISGNTITGNNNNPSYGGITLVTSSDNLISGNTISNNQNGINVDSQQNNNNVITKNTISTNTNNGITAGSSLKIYDNTISKNGYGIIFYFYSTGTVYDNNFINNQIQVQSASHSTFYLNPPIGGNYWSDYSTPTQGCSNGNFDNFCDTPYPFTGGTVGVVDNYPWTIQNGWHTIITTEGNKTAISTDNSPVAVSYVVTAKIDNTATSVTCSPQSGSMFSIGSTIVTCTASTGVKTSFSITVKQPDTIPPVVTAPANQQITATSNIGAVVNYPAPTATDNIGVTSGPTCSPPSGSTFSVGNTTVTCTASDAAANIGKATFTVTVNAQPVVDVTPPVIIPPQNLVLATNSQGIMVDYPMPTATDNVGVTSGPTCTPTSGSIFQIGTTTVTCTASDAAGNVGRATFSITVQQSQSTTSSTTTVSTDKSSYSSGDSIVVSGTVNPINSVNPQLPVTIQTYDIYNVLVRIDQAVPSPSGHFSATIPAHGPSWQNTGTYTLKIQYDQPSSASQLTFYFNSGTVSTQTPTQQINITSGGALNVGFSTDPVNPSVGVPTQLKINFLNKQTSSVQQHIDYKVSVNQGSSQILATPTTHTAEGSVSIPIQFQSGGTYTVTVEVNGVLFQPIPPQNAVFSLSVSGSQSTQPNYSGTTEIDVASGAGGSANAACVAANDCFAPNPLNVAIGTTVTWKNTDTVMHVVCSGKPSDDECGKVFEEDSLKPGKTFQFTFTNVGTYDYYCSVHPWMTGQVIVGAGIQPIQSTSTSGFTPTPQDIQNINQAKANQTIAAEVNIENGKTDTTSIDNSVSVQTTSNTSDSLNVNVSAPSQTGPKVIAFNLAATTINVQNLKDLGIMYDGKPISPAPNMDAILHAKSTDNPSFAIVVTQSGVQVLVLVPHFSTHSITITNMSKIIPAIPEFPFAAVVLLIAIFSIVLIPKIRY